MNEKAKQEEFLALYSPVNDRLARFARAMTRCPDEARDLVGETVLQAYENFDTLRDKAAFLSFIFTIARRIYLRKKWRERFFGRYDDAAAEQIPDGNCCHETRADVRLLYAALDKLPHKQKEAVILFEISGFSLWEIQEMQGGTLSGVKSRLKRGRSRLAELLTDAESARAKTKKGNGKADAELKPGISPLLKITHEEFVFKN